MQLIYAVVQTAVMIAILLPMLSGISMTMVDNGVLLANFTGYLIIRSVHVHRITGAGAAPLITYICLYIVPGIVLGVLSAVFQGIGNA